MMVANSLAPRRSVPGGQGGPGRPGRMSRARLMGTVSTLALTLAASAWLLAAPAAAADECGAPVPDPVTGVPTVNCGPGTVTQTGVVYSPSDHPGVVDLTINVRGDTTIIDNNGGGGIQVPGTGGGHRPHRRQSGGRSDRHGCPV